MKAKIVEFHKQAPIIEGLRKLADDFQNNVYPGIDHITLVLGSQVFHYSRNVDERGVNAVFDLNVGIARIMNAIVSRG